MHWLDGQILSQAGCGLWAAADLLISCAAVGDTVRQQHECQTAHAWHYTFKTSPENMFMWSCVTNPCSAAHPACPWHGAKPGLSSESEASVGPRLARVEASPPALLAADLEASAGLGLQVIAS